MIQLLLAPYTDKEVTKLQQLLTEMEKKVQDENCHGACFECAYRHLCDDLAKSKKFVENLRK